MILSNNVNTSIEVVLAGAITTNQLKCVATWVDTPSASFASGQTATSTNSTTAVTLVPAVTDTYRREVTYISVLNTDTANATVTIQLNVGGVATQIVKVNLATGSHLVYTQGSGWQIFTSGGSAPATGAGSYLEIANNLSDVSSAPTAFSNIKQAASETATGVAEIATQTETNTGTDDARFVTPLKFQTRLAAYAQPLDSDLTSIAGLTPSNDDVIQRKAGAWTNRTISQLIADLAALGTTFQPLDSDLTSISGLSPSNDDVLQYKSGAWTNRTISQYYADLLSSIKNDVYFTIPFIPGSLSPADSTTYYISPAGIAPSTTATNQDISLGYDFTVIGAVIIVASNTVSGTTEDSTMQLRNTTAATSTSIGTFKTNGSTTVVINTTITGLSINVGASDSFCLQWDAPAYATNPTGCAVRTILMCKRR